MVCQVGIIKCCKQSLAILFVGLMLLTLVGIIYFKLQLFWRKKQKIAIKNLITDYFQEKVKQLPIMKLIILYSMGIEPKHYLFISWEYYQLRNNQCCYFLISSFKELNKSLLLNLVSKLNPNSNPNLGLASMTHLRVP